MKEQTPAQVHRQKSRSHRSGRYIQVERCEVCRRPTGLDYCSWVHCNSYGLGVVLCEKHAGQVDNMTEEEALKLLRDSAK